MRTNVPIPEIPHGEDVSLIVSISSVRQRQTQQGRIFLNASARNSSGSIVLKVSAETLELWKELTPGLWSITGHLEAPPEKSQFVVTEYRRIPLVQYREFHGTDPVLPRAFTLDIETVAVAEFRDRVGSLLERVYRLGNMRLEQQQRYLEDIAAEEEHAYQLGSLSATSGRILCIAVHVGSVPDIDFGELAGYEREYVFGINTDAQEQTELETLNGFLKLLSDFDCETDELVGHNILGFDLPFIFQRCLVNNIRVRPFVNLADFAVRGVFDTMRQWWLGDRRGRVSLDDIAWALGIPSSKTADAEGSKVFDLYQAGRLADIREYNLNDVRVTRKVYERMVACFGR